MSNGPPVGRDGVVVLQADRSEETAAWDKLGPKTRAVLNENAGVGTNVDKFSSATKDQQNQRYFADNTGLLSDSEAAS